MAKRKSSHQVDETVAQRAARLLALAASARDEQTRDYYEKLAISVLDGETGEEPTETITANVR